MALALAAATAAASPALAATRFGPRQHVGFYVPWDPQAQADLALHVDDITVFAPQWINLSGAPGAFRIVPDDAAQDILRRAKRPPKVMPLVTNAHDAQWDAQAADAVLLDQGAQAAFVASMAAAAEERGFAGYILDFENLSPQGAAAYPALVAALRGALAPRRKEVWVTAPLLSAPSALQSLQAVADITVVMAYDQCWASSTPGPIAGLDWLTASLATRRAVLKPASSLVALGSYAYDWPEGAPAKVLTVAAAEALAQAHGAKIVRVLPSMNLAFDYQDERGLAHHVWMADAMALARARALVPGGAARWGLWRLGLEDPAIWSPSSEEGVEASVKEAPRPPCEPLSR